MGRCPWGSALRLSVEKGGLCVPGTCLMVLDFWGAPVSQLSKPGGFWEEGSQAGDKETGVESGPASVV